MEMRANQELGKGDNEQAARENHDKQIAEGEKRAIGMQGRELGWQTDVCFTATSGTGGAKTHTKRATIYCQFPEGKVYYYKQKL